MIKRGDKERSLLAKLSPRRRKNKSQSSRSPGIGNGGGGGNGFATTPPAGKGMASAGSSGGGGGSSVESMAEDAPTIPQTPGMMPYTIPTRYLVGCGMDLKEAARRWGITWQWRKDKDIDGLLERPMPHCEEAKRVWNHHFHRRAKHNFMEPDKPGMYIQSVRACFCDFHIKKRARRRAHAVDPTYQRIPNLRLRYLSRRS